MALSGLPPKANSLPLNLVARLTARCTATHARAQRSVTLIKPMPPSPRLLFVALIFAIPSPLCADADAGGGLTTAGSVTNRSSIGGPFETAVSAGGTYSIKPGQIQVLFSSTGNESPDANGNGLPDTWEQLYFPGQSVNPQADSDGDGTSNLLEYLAGTDPADPASRFRTEGAISGTTYTLPIQTSTGRSYKVWVSKDLTSWQLQQAYTGDGTQKVFSFDETTITSGPLFSATHPSNYFFRVEIILP